MTPPPLPARRSEIAPFLVMEVMRDAAAREAVGHPVLHLEVGQPSTPAPRGALAAAERALHDSALGYTEALGLPALRQRIAGLYRARHGLDIDPRRVVITTGASGGCLLAFLSLFDPGARVGLIAPGYPCYRNDLRALNIEPVSIPAGPESNYAPTLEQLDAAGPLDGLILNSPSNPTGTVLPADLLDTIAGWARARGTQLIGDETYHGLTYDGPAPSLLSHDREAFILNSFSKYYSMTGWRLGWIVAPERFLTPLERLAQNLSIAPPTLSQVAGLAALDCGDELDRHVAMYRRNRNHLLEVLPQAGFRRFAPPQGAFFLWLDISHLGMDSLTLCRRALHELDVAITPGIDFDPDRGLNFVRLSYAGAEAEIREAAARLCQLRA